MKVWICSTGSYSDKRTTAVYSDETVARQVSTAYGWNNPIEMELDPAIPSQVHEGLQYWCVELFFTPSGRQYTTSADVEEPAEWNCTRMLNESHKKVFQTFTWARDEDHAIKIGADRWAKFQYESKSFNLDNT